MAERRNRVVLNTRESITELLKHHKVDIYQGEAEVLSPTEVKVRFGKLNDETFQMHFSGAEETLETANIVLATGSKPLIPRLH